MKRWAGLLALFLVAAIGAVVIAPRFRPTDVERQHATIRVGMNPEEVARIMTGGNPEPPTLYFGKPGFTWSWLSPRKFMARGVRLEVDFDANASVTRTTVDGEQLQPWSPSSWSPPPSCPAGRARPLLRARRPR